MDMCSVIFPDSGQTDRFRINLDKHIEFVLQTYRNSSDMRGLIGDNPFEALEDAQQYLGKTILAVFEYRNVELQKRILPWVYRSYLRHGFSIEYFSNTLSLWIRSIEEQYSEPEVYTSLLTHLLDLDAENRALAQGTPPSWLASGNRSSSTDEDLQKLFQFLIEDNPDAAVGYLNELHEKNGWTVFEDLVRPVMYEVGRYWELDKISVADEHRISAVVSSFIASVTAPSPKTEKCILITPAPNEYHEIGAQMLAAAFMRKGWRVLYMNAGTSADEIIEKIAYARPDIVAFSAALILSALNLKHLVKNIKKRFPELPVMAGGRFIEENPDAAEHTGADAYAFGIEEALQKAEGLTGRKSETDK